MLLDDLMPWSTGPLRLGRAWVAAPDARTLRSRWDALVRADGPERRALFEESRLRALAGAATALPGQSAGTGRFAGERGPCPEPVRLARGALDTQWVIPDHRLIDIARPELWRVADEHQLFALEQPHTPDASGPPLLVSGVLPDGRSPTGRPCRIRPLYRRPGGAEPNLAPGALGELRARYGDAVAAPDVLAWALAAGRTTAAGCEVPFTSDPEVWARGVELGHRLMEVQSRGAGGGGRPRLPGGRRPYVRAAITSWPTGVDHDAEDESLLVGDGRIAPVAAGAWEFRVGGVRVLEHWFERRTAAAEPGTLEAVRPGTWPQEWTSDLLELITALTLLDQLEARRTELAAATERAHWPGPDVTPVPKAARAPASVLDHREEGPEGQFALL
jgi:hypothetical protein